MRCPQTKNQHEQQHGAASMIAERDAFCDGTPWISGRIHGILLEAHLHSVVAQELWIV